MSHRSFLPAEMRDATQDEIVPGSGVPLVREARDGAVYVLDDPLRLAVDVALATGRPLLLRGEPGSGKSTLAAYVARNLGWRYYEHVVTSRTSARDLLWTFDNVRKLADASAAPGGSASLRDEDYVEPGVLWWALDPESARRRGVAGNGPVDRPAAEPDAETNEERSPSRAVVLVDEIDKADPDVPNGLLVPLGSGEFRVAETGAVIRSRPVGEGNPTRGLTILTTNEERDLPPAFLRRCVSHTLPAPDEQRLVRIGRRHIAAASFLARRIDEEQLRALAGAVVAHRRQAAERARRPPSTAEFLDALWACASLGVTLDDPDWEDVSRLVLDKEGG